MNRTVAVVAAVLALIVAVPLIWTAVADSRSEGGMGIPTENLVDPPAGGTTDIGGVVHVAGNGCFHLDSDDGERYFVVWPDGFEQDAAEVVSPTGRYADGDRVAAGRGWIRSVDEVVAAADGENGYMAMVLGYCATEGELVAVIKTVATS
jgi:hypothetical protein